MLKEKIAEVFKDTNIAEEVIDQLVNLYQTSIKEKSDEIALELDEKYNSITEEYCEYVVEQNEQYFQDYIKEEVLPTVDRYLNLAVEEFVTENKVIVEQSAKNELADTFLKGIAQVSESFNVKVPESDVTKQIDELKESLSKANSLLDKALTEKAELAESVLENTKSKILDSVTEGLTESQIEKIKFVVEEKVKFINEDQYKDALEELRESHYPDSKSVEPTDKLNEKRLDEGNPDDNRSERISNYLSRLG